MSTITAPNRLSWTPDLWAIGHFNDNHRHFVFELQEQTEAPKSRRRWSFTRKQTGAAQNVLVLLFNNRKKRLHGLELMTCIDVEPLYAQLSRYTRFGSTCYFSGFGLCNSWLLNFISLKHSPPSCHSSVKLIQRLLSALLAPALLMFLAVVVRSSHRGIFRVVSFCVDDVFFVFFAHIL